MPQKSPAFQARGGTNEVGPLTQVYSDISQSDPSFGQWAGAQCTSMAIGAGIYWKLIRQLGIVPPTPQHVIDIIKECNKLHTDLRTLENVTNHADGRVGIDDILYTRWYPTRRLFNIPGVRFTFTDVPDYLLLYDEGIGLECVEQYYTRMETRGQAETTVLTVGDYSYNVAYNPALDKPWELFDSHGHFACFREWKLTGKASIFQFNDLATLCQFITERHPQKQQPVQAAVAVIQTKQDEDSSRAKVLKPIVIAAAMPIEPLTATEVRVKPAMTVHDFIQGMRIEKPRNTHAPWPSAVETRKSEVPRCQSRLSRICAMEARVKLQRSPDIGLNTAVIQEAEEEDVSPYVALMGCRV